jgi:hypothetical protein
VTTSIIKETDISFLAEGRSDDNAPGASQPTRYQSMIMEVGEVDGKPGLVLDVRNVTNEARFCFTPDVLFKLARWLTDRVSPHGIDEHPGPDPTTKFGVVKLEALISEKDCEDLRAWLKERQQVFGPSSSDEYRYFYFWRQTDPDPFPESEPARKRKPRHPRRRLDLH